MREALVVGRRPVCTLQVGVCYCATAVGSLERGLWNCGTRAVRARAAAADAMCCVRGALSAYNIIDCGEVLMRQLHNFSNNVIAVLGRGRCSSLEEWRILDKYILLS